MCAAGHAELRNKIYQFAVDLDDKKWFLGMPKSKKWMLYAQELDPFGLHNWLGFNLTRATGEYAARTQFCEASADLLQYSASRNYDTLEALTFHQPIAHTCLPAAVCCQRRLATKLQAALPRHLPGHGEGQTGALTTL